MRTAAGIAAVAALGLVAASSPASPAGTATTNLTAAVVKIDGVPVPVDDLSLIQLSSLASTDTDVSRNAKGAPFATATLAPLAVAGSNVLPPVTAASDGTTTQSTPVVSHAVGPVSAEVGIINLDATAAADNARALVSAADATINVLDGALALNLSLLPGGTQVNASGAQAVQSIVVGGVDLDLGSLLGVPVDDLPLDTVLQLADLLSNQLSVPGVDLAALDGALSTVEGSLGNLGALSSQYESVAGPLRTVLPQLAGLPDATQVANDLTTANGLVTAAQGLGAGDLLLTDPDLLNVVTGLTTLLGTYPASGVSIPSVVDLVSGTATLTDLLGSATGMSSYLQGIDGLHDQVGALTPQVQGVLGQITTQAGDLNSQIATLQSTLQGVLDNLEGILGQLPTAKLLDIDPLSLTVSAIATKDGGTPSLTCTGGSIAVVGVNIASSVASCDALAAPGTLTSALGTLGSILGTLSIAEVPTPVLELFATKASTSGTDGVYQTADAAMDLLRLNLPSVNLDGVTGGAVDGILSQLAAGDLTTVLNSLNGTLGADRTGALGTVTGLAGSLDGTLAGISPTLTSATGLQSLLGTVSGTIAGSIPAGLATPGIDVLVDPSAHAEFAPGAASGGPDSGPGGGGAGNLGAPAGTTGTSGDLPLTGGGFALLGAAALGAGLRLRRRS